jgi:8-oxo-dGTP pyrophosphatase MutT (NUDIX family)
MAMSPEDWAASRNVRPDKVPPALSGLVRGISSARPEELSRNDPVAREFAERQAAVLILIATDGPDGPDVLLQQRAPNLRDHAGEISFPGGSREPDDPGPVETALREAVEETGLDPAGVDPLAILPRLHIPPSRFDVSGVLAHWRAPSVVGPVDAAETERVMRIALSRLADPGNRLDFDNGAGWSGPAFRVDGSLIWGYTAEIIDALLRFDDQVRL